jgi:pyruvate/2-oxoglutarate dehydrogenase complex dihydrolipoamide dehydrogenase (E3) component
VVTALWHWHRVCQNRRIANAYGGTCALRGCDPKKVLVGAAAAVDGTRAISGKGVRPDGLSNPDFTVKHEDTSSWYSSRRVGETCSGFKVLVENGTGRILGAHLLGPHADETINLFALAMRTGTTADRFKDMLWAYPTHASSTSYMV